MKSSIINVLDTEATCYPDGKFPEGEQQELIEFGISMIDLRTFRIIKTLSIPVIPVMSSVSQYCTELTGWTYVKLQRQGVTLANACQRLVDKYGARNRLLVVDSDNEIPRLREYCRKAGVDYPFGDSQLNVSTLFALLTGELRNLTLEAKLAHLGLQFEGTPHRGSDDSRNIARLLLKLRQQASITCGAKPV